MTPQEPDVPPVEQVVEETVEAQKPPTKLKISGTSIFWSAIFVLVLIGLAIWDSDEDTSVWMNLLYELILLTLVAVGIWELGKRKIRFIFLARNQVSIVESGEKPVKLIGIPPDGYVIKGMEIVKANEDEVQKYGILEGMFGLFFIGPPWRKIRRFILIHERMSTEIDEKTPATKWIERDAEEEHEPEWFLLVSSLHVFLVPGVELAKGYIANILVQAELILTRPTVSIYDRAGSQANKQGFYKVDFYKPISDLINTAIDNACRGMGYGPELSATGSLDKGGFQAADKSASSDLCIAVRSESNKTMAKLSGYVACEVFIPRWDLSTTEQQDLVRELEKARINRDKAALEAQTENAGFAELIKAIRLDLPDATHSEVLAMATQIQKSKNIAKMQNLTVYAADGSNLAVSTPQPQPPRPPNSGKKGNK